MRHASVRTGQDGAGEPHSELSGRKHLLSAWVAGIVRCREILSEMEAKSEESRVKTCRYHSKVLTMLFEHLLRYRLT